MQLVSGYKLPIKIAIIILYCTAFNADCKYKFLKKHYFFCFGTYDLTVAVKGNHVKLNVHLD